LELIVLSSLIFSVVIVTS